MRLYTDLVTRNYEALVGKQAALAMGDFDILDTPVAVRINAYYKIPKGWTKKKKAQAIAGELVPGTSDIDNVAKSICDGIQNIVITNDRNVVKLSIEKSFSSQPRVEVCVYEVLP